MRTVLADLRLLRIRFLCIVVWLAVSVYHGKTRTCRKRALGALENAVPQFLLRYKCQILIMGSETL